MALLRAPRVSLCAVLLPAVVACGSPPPKPPAPALAPAPLATAPKEPPIDISPVAEPPGLIALGRVTEPSAILSAVGSWTKFPLPSASVLLQTMTEPAVADVVDLSQPVDAALAVAPSRHGIEPIAAFSVAVKSYDQAKARLGSAHRLIAEENGVMRIDGLTLGEKRPAMFDPSGQSEDDGDGDDDVGCVLAPAASGGRLVCGERAAVEALAPYLSRTMPREKWQSDIHLELRPEPVREPLLAFRSILPLQARSLFGGMSPAVHELIDSALGEVMDLVADTQKVTVDAQVADTGIVATTRFAFESNRSLISRAVTSSRGDAPPTAFWHLPAETDTAFFGRGYDAKLFEHPRELLSNVILEAAESASMPEQERKALKELVVDRLLSLFATGTSVYAKGFDTAALEKTMNAAKAVKPGDAVGFEEGRTAVLEQVVGWHLYQVSEPVAKVGPMLKDLSNLWNRPAFAKWMKEKTSKTKSLAQFRITPSPAGVKVPKDTVHLEIAIPHDDVWSSGPNGKPTAKKLKPTLFHVFAVPDGGATWLAFGFDAKLVAQKASATVAPSSDAVTLAKARGIEALREGPISGGGFFTARGVTVFTALDDRERSPFGSLSGLAHKGTTPLVFAGHAEPPTSSASKGGASVSTMRISRAFIEDLVALVMSAR